MTKSWLFDIAIIIFGIGLTVYSVSGIVKYGFYLSPRGDPGQLNGGLVPLFLLVGILSIAYGVGDLIIFKKNDNRKEKQ